MDLLAEVTIGRFIGIVGVLYFFSPIFFIILTLILGKVLKGKKKWIALFLVPLGGLIIPILQGKFFGGDAGLFLGAVLSFYIFGLVFYYPLISIIWIYKRSSWNKTNKVIATVFVFLIPFVGFSLLDNHAEKERFSLAEQAGDEVIEKCLKEPERQVTNCLKELAFERNNLTICQYIGDGKIQKECYQDLIKENDISICQTVYTNAGNLPGSNISGLGSGWTISKRCYTHFAISQRDPEVCFVFDQTDSQLSCLKDFAIYYNDSSVCSLTPAKENCLKQFEMRSDTFHSGLIE